MAQIGIRELPVHPTGGMSRKAGGAMSTAYSCVREGPNSTVIETTGPNETCTGFIQEVGVSVVTGDAVTVYTEGVVLAVANEIFAAGIDLTSDVFGRVRSAGAGEKVCGVSQGPSTAILELVPVLVGRGSA